MKGVSVYDNLISRISLRRVRVFVKPSSLILLTLNFDFG